jgi:signal transducing adaptor molecule
VTADLSAEPGDTTKDLKTNKKNVQFTKNSYESEKTEQQIDINEDAIDRLLFLLHEADPSEPSQDSDEMLRLESAVNQMGPLIDAELERVDRKHAQLTQLSSDLIDTINLYHSLMRETEKMPLGANMPYGYAPGNYQMPPVHMNSPGGPPQQMNQMPPNFSLMAKDFSVPNVRNFAPPPSLNQMPMQNTFFHDANAPSSFGPISHQPTAGQEHRVNPNVPPGTEIPQQYLQNSGNVEN